MAVNRFIMIGIAALLTPACIAIPYNLQGAIKDSAVKEIKPYVSTLEDMIAVAGEPRMIWANRRIALFDDGNTDGGTVIFVGGVGMDYAGDPEVYLVRFDEDGVITQLEKKDHPKPRASGSSKQELPDWATFIKAWADAPQPPAPDADEDPQADGSA